ncbi:MAG: hypothetical protein ACREML_09855 [Vulcanimicrobiaceae bacterium]
MASKGGGKGDLKGQKFNMAVNVRRADIISASKSQNGAESYEKGYPAHDSVHINENSKLRQRTGSK